jgi:hypothetical protein
METQSSTEYTVTITAVIDRQFILDVIDAAGYGIGYWADAAEVDEESDVYRVREVTTYESVGVPRQTTEHVITFEALAQALGKLAADGWQSIQQGLAERDAGHIDSQGGDAAVQMAAFGELVYG